jgi:hypothetical protein
MCGGRWEFRIPDDLTARKSGQNEDQEGDNNEDDKDRLLAA